MAASQSTLFSGVEDRARILHQARTPITPDAIHAVQAVADTAGGIPPRPARMNNLPANISGCHRSGRKAAAHTNVRVTMNASPVAAKMSPRPTEAGLVIGGSRCASGSIDPASESGTGRPHSEQIPSARPPRSSYPQRTQGSVPITVRPASGSGPSAPTSTFGMCLESTILHSGEGAHPRGLYSRATHEYCSPQPVAREYHFRLPWKRGRG